nr:MAG TPA: 4Fe-4S single cluster domain protein [Caudoviricetes sp.]
MNYIKISKYDIANGTGIGVVLWVSGCNRHCHGCHNPQTWDFNAGQPFTEDTMQELLEALNKPYISRLTLSGGHPLESQNLETVYQIVKTVKEKFPNKKIWLYTGYTWEEILNNDKENKRANTNSISPLDIVRCCDILVDGKYEKDKRDISLAFAGSSNQRVVDIQKSFKQNKVVLYCD